jgi:hypothetical protein
MKYFIKKKILASLLPLHPFERVSLIQRLLLRRGSWIKETYGTTNFPAFNIPIVCLPASINNNLPGTEFSIGFAECPPTRMDCSASTIVLPVTKMLSGGTPSRGKNPIAEPAPARNRMTRTSASGLAAVGSAIRGYAV